MARAIRDSKGRFINGNPGGGRPKLSDDARNALQAMSDRSFDILAQLLEDRNTDNNLRVKIACYFIDHAIGRPHQQLELQPNDNNIIRVNIVDD